MRLAVACARASTQGLSQYVWTSPAAISKTESVRATAATPKGAWVAGSLGNWESAPQPMTVASAAQITIDRVDIGASLLRASTGAAALGSGLVVGTIMRCMV